MEVGTDVTWPSNPTILGAYEVLTGLGILGWWVRDLANRRPAAARLEEASHLVAELITAAALLLGGAAALIGGFIYALSVLGLGMLLYATVNAVGRAFANSRKLGLVMLGEGVATAAIIVFLLAAA